MVAMPALSFYRRVEEHYWLFSFGSHVILSQSKGGLGQNK